MVLLAGNGKPFMPTGVVTDANWWVDGHAKQRRQQHLEMYEGKSAIGARRIDDSQTKG